MVVMVILAVIIVGVFGVVVTQNKAYHSEEDIIEMQANAQMALQRLNRLIRLAGYGCKDSFGTNMASGNLATKGDVAPNPLTSLLLVNGLNDYNNDNDYSNEKDPGTDDLTIVSAFKYLGKVIAVPAGNQVTLNVIGTLKADDVDIAKSYFYVSPAADQRFHIADNVTGNTITSHDFINAQVNDPVYQVQAFTIRLVAGNLRIDDNVNSSTASLDVAENIENLQFQYGIDTDNDGHLDSWVDNPSANLRQVKAVRVFILARTPNEDRDYTDKKTYNLGSTSVGPFNDGYHRYQLSTIIMMRNLNF